MKHLSHPPVIKHWRPGPKHPIYGIPASQWMAVVQRMTEKKNRSVPLQPRLVSRMKRSVASYIMDSKQRGQQES